MAEVDIIHNTNHFLHSSVITHSRFCNMATIFPRFILLQHSDMKHSFFAFREGDYMGVPNSIVVESEKGVHNTLAKIELEPAKINSRYFHLRYCYINRYCALNNAEDGFVVAESKTPEEDKSKLSCTLFEPTRADDDGNLHLIHVHTGWRAQMDGYTLLLLVAKKDSPWTKFKFVDWDTIVKLPEHVAFKGDNGRYLQAHWQDGLPYLEFSSDDAYDKSSGFRVELRPDGYVRIKSDYFGKFWRLSPNWIWADEDRESWHPDIYDDSFWPIRIDNDTIALRNGTNNNYCVRLPDIDWKINCLNAAVPNITNEARLVVEELVQERKIYGVIYRMEDARIFDQMPYVAGSTTVYNKGDQEASVEAEVSYEEENLYTFSRGVSLTAGVTTTIQAGVPLIVEGEVDISFEISGSLEWAHTESKKKAVKATGKLPVPARSMGVVHYVGTKGTCNVPYSYTQQDTSSTDGKISYSVQNDGMYTGVNCYNFQFVMDKVHPIVG